jgi:Mrp family chromosome partitioning ATPase
LSAFAKQVRPVPPELVERKAGESAGLNDAELLLSDAPAIPAARATDGPGRMHEKVALDFDDEPSDLAVTNTSRQMRGVLISPHSRITEPRLSSPDRAAASAASAGAGSSSRVPESTAGQTAVRSEVGEVTDALRRAGRERDRSLDASHANTEGAPAPSPISRSREGPWKARAVLVDSPGARVDQFRHFALRVRRSLDERGARSVLITSPLQGEGKTLVSCNLALALASMAGESRIALLDLDLHHPSVATALGVAPGSGVETVLLGEKNLRAARVRTDVPALDLFPIARPVSHPHEVLARSALRSLITELSEQYTTLVCDGPPGLLVPDVELIAPHLGACVLVVKAGVTRVLAVRELIAMLPRENIIGTFLNFSSLPRHAEGYSYYASEGEPGAGITPREPFGRSDD